MGTERQYGADYKTPFTDYDTDSSGYIDTTEFDTGWDNEYHSGWDTDNDALLTEDEFSAGVNNAADIDSNKVITVEEEGWFDGNDVEAEIAEVGEVI